MYWFIVLGAEIDILARFPDKSEISSDLAIFQDTALPVLSRSLKIFSTFEFNDTFPFLELIVKTR